MADLDLADLAVLIAVARAHSFRGAASLRNVSASFLSEALRRPILRHADIRAIRGTCQATPASGIVSPAASRWPGSSSVALKS